MAIVQHANVVGVPSLAPVLSQCLRSNDTAFPRCADTESGMRAKLTLTLLVREQARDLRVMALGLICFYHVGGGLDYPRVS